VLITPEVVHDPLAAAASNSRHDRPHTTLSRLPLQAAIRRPPTQRLRTATDSDSFPERRRIAAVLSLVRTLAARLAGCGVAYVLACGGEASVSVLGPRLISHRRRNPFDITVAPRGRWVVRRPFPSKEMLRRDMSDWMNTCTPRARRRTRSATCDKTIRTDIGGILPSARGLEALPGELSHHGTANNTAVCCRHVGSTPGDGRLSWPRLADVL
jgi:hypothetical protein